MKIFQNILLLCLVLASQALPGQSAPGKFRIFNEDTPLDVTLMTDLGNLISGKIRDRYQNATFTCKRSDSSVVSEEIRISARGHTRRSICNMPPIRLTFNNPGSPKLYSLKALKLVNVCRSGAYYQQLLLKEYLIYRIYNLLTEKSFRVRLFNLTYLDSKGKKKPLTRFAFVVENIDALAKRNQCKEWDHVLTNETANREQTTMVAIFQYMIGNTDWSVRGKHNIKLVISRKDSTSKPYPVPYDFDYAGLVNAEYAIPDPELRIDNVLQRLYRGFPRTMDELQAVLEVYKRQKENIYALIRNFELLDSQHKKEMINYLDGFYNTIKNPREVKYTFIDNARQ